MEVDIVGTRVDEEWVDKFKAMYGTPMEQANFAMLMSNLLRWRTTHPDETDIQVGLEQLLEFQHTWESRTVKGYPIPFYEEALGLLGPVAKVLRFDKALEWLGPLLGPFSERKMTASALTWANAMRDYWGVAFGEKFREAIRTSFNDRYIAQVLDSWTVNKRPAGFSWEDPQLSWEDPQLEQRPYDPGADPNDEWVPYPFAEATASAPPGTRCVNVDSAKLRTWLGERFKGLENLIAEGNTHLAEINNQLTEIQAQLGAVGTRLERIGAQQDLLLYIALRRELREQQAARQQAYEALAQTSLQALGSGFSLASWLVGKEDLQVGRQLAAAGTLLLTTGNTVLGALKSFTNLGVVGGAIGTAALSGNLISAVVGFVSAMSGTPNQEEVILAQLQAIQEQIGQLHQDMDRRFDRVDQQLATVIGLLANDVMPMLHILQQNLDAVTETLHQLSADVLRVEVNLDRFFQDDRVLQIDLLRSEALRYLDRSGRPLPLTATGADDLSYLHAESQLVTFAAGVAATDNIATGGVRPVNVADLDAQLAPGKYSAGQNIVYLDRALRALNLPGFLAPGEVLPNPELWLLSAGTLAALNVHYPGYALSSQGLRAD